MSDWAKWGDAGEEDEEEVLYEVGPTLAWRPEKQIAVG